MSLLTIPTEIFPIIWGQLYIRDLLALNTTSRATRAWLWPHTKGMAVRKIVVIDEIPHITVTMTVIPQLNIQHIHAIYSVYDIYTVSAYRINETPDGRGAIFELVCVISSIAHAYTYVYDGKARYIVSKVSALAYVSIYSMDNYVELVEFIRQFNIHNHTISNNVIMGGTCHAVLFKYDTVKRNAVLSKYVNIKMYAPPIFESLAFLNTMIE